MTICMPKNGPAILTLAVVLITTTRTVNSSLSSIRLLSLRTDERASMAGSLGVIFACPALENKEMPAICGRTHANSLYRHFYHHRRWSLRQLICVCVNVGQYDRLMHALPRNQPHAGRTLALRLIPCDVGNGCGNKITPNVTDTSASVDSWKDTFAGMRFGCAPRPELTGLVRRACVYCNEMILVACAD